MATAATRIEREENLAHKTKNKRTDLTPTGLLMEGVRGKRAYGRFVKDNGKWESGKFLDFKSCHAQQLSESLSTPD